MTLVTTMTPHLLPLNWFQGGSRGLSFFQEDYLFLQQTGSRVDEASCRSTAEASWMVQLSIRGLRAEAFSLGDTRMSSQ